MNYFHIILIFICTTPSLCIGQKKKKFRFTSDIYYTSVFGSNDRDFDVTEIPERYKQEPSVILCRKQYLALVNNPKYGIFKAKNIIRQRELINDNSVLEEFTEYYFHETYNTRLIVIKPDGEEQIVDLTKAIEVKTEVPKKYRNKYRNSNYYKIAIPGLQVGDIIDYYCDYDVENYYYMELLQPVAHQYPVLVEEFVIDSGKDWTLYFDSFNGASAFIEDYSSGINKRGQRKKNIRRIRLKQEHQSKIEYEPWQAGVASIPHFKLMAIPPKSMLSNKKHRLQKGLDLEKVFFKSLRSIDQIIDRELADLKSKVQKLGIFNMTEEEKCALIYRRLKLDCLSRILDKKDYEEVIRGNSSAVSWTNSYLIYDDIFAVLYSRVLGSFNVKSNIIMAASGMMDSLNNVVLRSDLTFGVYVPSIDEYFWPPRIFTESTEFPIDLEGSYALSVDAHKRARNAKSVDITLPQTQSFQNRSVNKLKVDIVDQSTLHLNVEVDLSGHMKSEYQSFLLFNTDYYSEGLSDILTKSEKKKAKNEKKRSKRQSIHSKSTIGLTEEIDETRNEIITTWIKNDLEISELVDYRIMSHGMVNYDDPLQINFNATSEELINKAGKNIILHAGALIGEQIDLDEEFLINRKSDIDFNYAKEYNFDIEIPLKEGQSAKGLEELTFNIDNEDAAFHSEAYQEGNLIRISAKKRYKKKMVPKERWKNIVDMVQAAQNFSNKKIIIEI